MPACPRNRIRERFFMKVFLTRSFRGGYKFRSYMDRTVGTLVISIWYCYPEFRFAVFGADMGFAVGKRIITERRTLM